MVLLRRRVATPTDRNSREEPSNRRADHQGPQVLEHGWVGRRPNSERFLGDLMVAAHINANFDQELGPNKRSLRRTAGTLWRRCSPRQKWPIGILEAKSAPSI